MTDYKNPTPTVDIIIEVDSSDTGRSEEDHSEEDHSEASHSVASHSAASHSAADRQVVLIRRKNAPHGWALPGGFVDEGETVENAAVREADEETGLKVMLQDLLYVYSHPDRDPRQHTMSTVFVATASGEPCGGDDADEARLFSCDELPEDLVFDHARILNHYFKFRDSGERPSPMAELERFNDDNA
jgi:8-oxo-dGTP diphosphatase